LDSLAKKVDSKGIDVLRRWSDSSPSPRERPILAPLQEFTSASEAKTAQKLWMKDFKGNIHSFLVGIRDTHGRPTPMSIRVPPDLEEFKHKWDEARPSQRVFISFARADFEHARAVKQALDDQGYTTFIYLGKAQGSPLVTANEAGHFFATAEHHFVIDTQNARRSSGVWFERALLGRYGKAPGGDVSHKGTPGRPPSPPPTGPNVTRCTCKFYRNGILVNSRQILPGVMCGKQRCPDAMNREQIVPIFAKINVSSYFGKSTSNNISTFSSARVAEEALLIPSIAASLRTDCGR
jgi:hypothetical protein